MFAYHYVPGSTLHCLQVRIHLKQEGFGAKRIAELIVQTRPAALAQDPDNFLEELETHLDAMDMAGEEAAPLTEEQQIQEVLAEWEFEACRSSEGQPQVLQPDVLPSPSTKDPQEQHAEEDNEEALGEEDAAEEGEPAEPNAKRARRGDKTCPGRSQGKPCVFSQHPDHLGSPARLGPGKTRCQLCDPVALEAAVADPQRKKHITRALRLWTNAGRQDLVDAAMDLIPEAHRKGFQQALQRPSRAAPAVAARAAAKAQAHEEEWTKAMEKRQWPGGPFSEEEQQVHQRKKQDDARRVRSKFGPWVAALEEGDNSWRSPLATRFIAWCKEHSWAACSKCHRLEKRPLRESHVTGRHTPSATIAECAHCKNGTGYPTVTHNDIPEVLRGLTDDVIWALRPLEPDVGMPVWAKHGNRVKTDMIRFWWRHLPVAAQIQQLESEADRAAALAAFQFLMSSPDSSYKKFVDMHTKFLHRNRASLEGPWDRKLQLPRRALEEEGLECAAWPHLYPRTNMCETYIRLQDRRRQERRAAPKAPAQPVAQPARPVAADSSGASSSTTSSSSTSSTSSDVPAPRAKTEKVPAEGQTAATAKEPQEEDSDSDSGLEEPDDTDDDDEAEATVPLDFARPGRNSAKSAYLAKVLGPVLGYGATYELFQFVYDLWLWTAVGAKKNTVEAPMRLAMAGYSFAPEYWQTRHAALVDMVKQLGYPTMFITVAPYEWSFPFHRWVEDEAEKLLRGKLHLPVAETLHIAHVLAQTVQGLLTGANKKTQWENAKAWRSHVLAAKDGSGRKTVLNFFGRLEYQDGKRKRYVNQQEAAIQFYHGRGTVHLHLLVWLQHVEATRLEDSVSATVPADNEVMASLVEGSQRSWTGSGWPKEPGPSHYDAEKGVLHLHHSDTDYCRYKQDGTAEGIRAYLVDVLSSLGCHVDVQMSDGRGMLLKYVSGYVPKFSDSFTTDWLCDAGSDYAVAKRVVTDFYPLTPEMTCQLSMQWFPQCFAGSTLQRFVVPVPWIGEIPARIIQYMQRAWRAADMTLAEFLRKTNKAGAIHQKLKWRYEQAKKAAEANEEEIWEQSLQEWANNAPSQGEVAVAAIYLSRYNDRYYGQWVLMNVPFRDPERDLKRPELDLVPDHLYYQALAYLHRPEHWTNPAAIKEQLGLEGFRDYHIKNITAMVMANQGLIRKYLDGTLDKNREATEDAGQNPAGPASGAEGFALSRQQAAIADEILESVRLGVKQRQEQENAWKGEGPDPEQSPFAPAAPLRPAIAVLGPAGSGKTTAVHHAIREVAKHQCRILLAAPTGRLAATMREKFPDLEVDTVHGAFLVYKPVHETLEVMLPYDLVIVEEVGQLSRANFERIMEQWQAAEKLPTLVFVGDVYQLPGVEKTSAWDSPWWHNVNVKKKELHTMQRCKCPKLRKTLELLRTNKPSLPQLKEIVKGHKAPSLGRAGYVMNETPSLDDIRHILEETPQTMFLTISRKAAAYLNDLAVQVLFSDEMPLAVLPADPESNLWNWWKGKMVAEVPLEVPIYKGAYVILTKNLNKEIGFVNGMGATVIAMDKNNVIVRTDQGKLLAVHPWTSENHVVHYPLRLGYASTLHKVQGATLKHITLWLDVRNFPAAAYVGLSRVEYDANWRFVGNPSIHHFTPATFQWA